MPELKNMGRDYLAETTLSQISGSETWKEIEPVIEGWSDEVRYHISTDAGDELLLRIGDAKRKAHNTFLCQRTVWKLRKFAWNTKAR